MAYQGISPRIYQQNNLTNVQLIDDISSQFNGTTTTFTMTSGGDTFHAVASRAIFIVLGGIVQEPDVDYTTAGDEITFTTAPVSGLTFAGRKIYGLNKLEGINDGLVTPSKLSLGGPSWDNSGNTTTSGYAAIGSYATVAGDITQSGDTNNIFINTDTPTVRPTLDLNFERDQRLDSRITFTRSSTATYLGSDGLIKTALADQPRFDFDANGNCLGLLIEESRTNKLPYSVDFSNAEWTKINGGTGSAPTVTTNYAISPDGTTTASRIQAELGAGTNPGDYTLVRENILTDGTDHTWSVWLKSNTGADQKVLLSWYNPSDFNISPEPVTVTSTWQRFSSTKQQASFEADIGMRGDATDITRSVDILAWGGQLEDASFATSYIPTSGSTVTRASDNTSITGTNFTDFYNNTEFSLYTEVIASAVTSYDKRIVNITGTSKRQLDFWLDGYFNIYNYDSTISFTGANLTSGDIVAGTEHKAAVAIKNSDFFLTHNAGTTDASSTNAQMFTDVNTMHIGSLDSNGNYSLNGHIKRLTYYPKRLPNSQLQNLTK